MQKSAEAFRTISEVASEIEVPKHVLRFWEGKFVQVKPMKRGGGRRYYRPEDVDLLRGIRQLLYDNGYTIKGVQKLLRKEGIDYVKGCWRNVDVYNAANNLPNAPEIPDLAEETARRAAVPKNGRARQKTPKKNNTFKTAQPQTIELTQEQRKRLTRALSELETCKKLIAQISY